jgi:hypothetical protein
MNEEWLERRYLTMAEDEDTRTTQQVQVAFLSARQARHEREGAPFEKGFPYAPFKTLRNDDNRKLNKLGRLPPFNQMRAMDL